MKIFTMKIVHMKIVPMKIVLMKIVPMQIVPRVNHLPQPLLSRLLRVDPPHLRSGKSPHVIHHYPLFYHIAL